MGILQLAHRCLHCREHKDFVMFQMSEIVRQNVANRVPPLWDSRLAMGFEKSLSRQKSA